VTSSSLRWSVGFSLVAVSQLLLITGLILLPQWRAQTSAREGVITFFVGGDGTVRLWNRPIDAAVMPAVVQRAERFNANARVRLVASPGVTWGVVQDLVSLLDQTSLDVELQLPPTARP
jgi:biopolymer transport protein ExbD